MLENIFQKINISWLSYGTNLNVSDEKFIQALYCIYNTDNLKIINSFASSKFWELNKKHPNILFKRWVDFNLNAKILLGAFSGMFKHLETCKSIEVLLCINTIDSVWIEYTLSKYKNV
jgi:hypothetical protein